jgi:hypothetical protein
MGPRSPGAVTWRVLRDWAAFDAVIVHKPTHQRIGVSINHSLCPLLG